MYPIPVRRPRLVGAWGQVALSVLFGAVWADIALAQHTPARLNEQPRNQTPPPVRPVPSPVTEGQVQTSREGEEVVGNLQQAQGRPAPSPAVDSTPPPDLDSAPAFFDDLVTLITVG